MRTGWLIRVMDQPPAKGISNPIPGFTQRSTPAAATRRFTGLSGPAEPTFNDEPSMAHITSRKHSITRNALGVATATLMTGLVMAPSTWAADAPADTGPSTTTPKNLAGVQ